MFPTTTANEKTPILAGPYNDADVNADANADARGSSTMTKYRKFSITLSVSLLVVSAATFGLISVSKGYSALPKAAAAAAIANNPSSSIPAVSLVIAQKEQQQEKQKTNDNNNNNNSGNDDDDDNDDEEGSSIDIGEILFEDFVRKYGKTYDSDDEKNRRKDIFHKNVETIQSHNNNNNNNNNDHEGSSIKQHSWTMGINHFADMLQEEVHKGFDKGALHGTKAHEAFSGTTSHLFSTISDSGNTATAAIITSSSGRRNLRTSDLPKSIDWRTHKSSHGSPITTPVKDQGMCGSCWAFAATSVLESHVAIATGELFDLSPQELVSCAPNPNNCGGTGGCAGSTGELAFDYVSKHGMVSEWIDGYTSYWGETGNCTMMESPVDGYLYGARASIIGFSSLPTNSYDSLMYAVATLGPVVLSVAASTWRSYHGGVFDDSDITSHYDINHAVVLEGYGTDEATGEDFWLVRNSWGVLWGEDGYIRLKRTDPATLEDPMSDCKTDITPSHGVACEGPDNNATIPDQLVCGTSGILYANVIPVGARLVGH